MVRYRVNNPMEDVLANSQSARQRPLPAEPASWTGRGPAVDPDPAASLSFPLSALFSLIEAQRDYAAACRELAALLKRLPDGHTPEGLLLQALRARFPRVWTERFLFVLLAVQPSDWQTAGYVLQFRNLKRLLHRVERRAPLNTAESTLARELIAALALSRALDLDPFCREAAATFRDLRAGKLAVSGDLGLLIYLVRCECGAMAERKRWLEDGLPSGDPDAVARLAPHLDLLESRMAGAQALAQRLGRLGALQETSMGLEEAMGPFCFERLLEGLEAPGSEDLKRVMELQRAKRAPTRDLIALSSLCRWLAEARGTSAGPLDWVRMALEAYDHGHFRLDVRGGLPAVEALLREARVVREDSWVSGHFGEYAYSSWTARDGLTRPFRSSNPERLAPDLPGLVRANLHRETVILKMLDEERVRMTPGLVEAIVAGSPSPVVHAKIASRPELRTGPACARVAAALLRSGVAIPAALWQPLLHPDLVPFPEMKALYRDRAALRPEVAEALRAYLKQAYAP
jgi:hypothetical protein